MIYPSQAKLNNGRRIAIGFAILFALLTLVAACGGTDAYLEPSASSPEATASAISEDDESPLLQLLGVPIDGDETLDDYMNDRYAQAESQITVCMASNGFDYVPFDYSQFENIDESYTDTREYAAEYGFGIAAAEDPLHRQELLPGEVATNPEIEVTDPNGAYIASLSPGEQDAFSTALYGDRTAGSTGSQGCQGQAFDDAFAVFMVIEEFGFYDDLNDAVQADPRVVTAEAQWADCMSQAGYGFSDRSGAEATILRELEDVIFDRSNWIEDLETLRPEARRQIDDLATRERAIAVAGWDCDIPRREVERVVEREYEQHFVGTHGAAVRDALAS